MALNSFFIDKLSKCGDDDTQATKAKYLHGVPFFCHPEETEETTTNKNNKQSSAIMSSAVTSIKRACLKKFFHFRIYFGKFDMGEGEGVPVINESMRDKVISRKYAQALSRSFEDLQKNDFEDEKIQVSNIMKVLQPILHIWI